jgi:hypothetical protein
MKSTIKRGVLLAKSKLGIDKMLMLLGGVRSTQNRAEQNFDTLRDAEFSVYSQWGEDGIIDFLVANVPIRETVFIEIGTEDYSESNTRFLLQHRHWRGLIIDGSPANMAAVDGSDIGYKFDLKTKAAFVTRENVAELIATDDIGARAGLFSLDIDGVDYWVLEAMPHRPEIIVVEYADILGDQPVSVPYDAKFERAKKHYSNIYYGASLPAFDYLLSARGYTFVGSNGAGTNAFFVRSDVAGGVISKIKRLIAWPSQMREARDKQGRLLLEDRRRLMYQVADLPLVRVDTGASISVADALPGITHEPVQY